jgi:hypothetical protein
MRSSSGQYKIASGSGGAPLTERKPKRDLLQEIAREIHQSELQELATATTTNNLLRAPTFPN